MKQRTIRFPDDVEEELQTLCKAYGVPLNTIVVSAVRAEYHKYDSDPKISQTLEDLKTLQSALEAFAKRK